VGTPDGSSNKEIIHRIGTFFILVGVALMVFFIISESTRQTDLEYFCWSGILLILGFVFRGQFRKTPQPSGRFSIIKRLTPKSKQDQGKKK
jgi:predicted membrane channel-forming protein YqfA (hemolysin III family)